MINSSSEEEKNEWFEKLSDCVNRRFKPKSTTVTVAVKIEGRQQVRILVLNYYIPETLYVWIAPSQKLQNKHLLVLKEFL